MTDFPTVDASFSRSYTEARQKFLSSCKAQGLAVESRRNPNVEDVALYCDIARMGAEDAEHCLFILSATHGVEGYCGSGVQIDFLTSDLPASLPANVAVVLVHAVNPYGFHFDRRVTEENVDLNRNFLDFSAERPVNVEYARVHDMLVPDDWEGPAYAKAENAIKAFVDTNGEEAFKAALTGGQYQFPGGIFFGGHAPTWARQNFEDVLAAYGANASQIAVIDVHTGLGPFGEAEMIVMDPDDQYPRAQSWYGDNVSCPSLAGSLSSPVSGTMGGGVAAVVPHAQMTYAAIEYGTLSVPEVLQAVRAANWLDHNQPADNGVAERINQSVRDAFYADSSEWKSMVVERSRKAIGQAIEGMTS